MAPALARVAGVFQRAVGRSCVEPASQPGRHEPRQRPPGAGLSLENLLPVLRRAMRPSLPSAQWHFAIRPQFLRRRFRDFLRRRDKSLL